MTPASPSLLDRIRNALRDYDGLSLVCLALARLAARLGLPLRLHSYLIVAQPVRPLSSAARRKRSFETRLLGRGAPDLASLPRPAAVIEDRFRQGARCIGLFHEERLIGCAWLCLGPYDEDEVRCHYEPRPPESTAWDFDIYLDERFRIGFAFATLWSAVNAWLTEQGVHWTLSRISTFNPASLRAHRRLGAVSLQRATFVSLGGGQLMLATCRPWVHLSLAAATVPHLAVDAPRNAAIADAGSVQSSS